MSLAVLTHSPAVAGAVVPPEGAVFAGETLRQNDIDAEVAVDATLYRELVGTVGKLDWVLVEAFLGLDVVGSLEWTDSELEVANVVGRQVYDNRCALALLVAV